MLKPSTLEVLHLSSSDLINCLVDVGDDVEAIKYMNGLPGLLVNGELTLSLNNFHISLHT